MEKFTLLDKMGLILSALYIIWLIINTYVFDKLPNNMQVIFAVWFIVSAYDTLNSKK